MTAKLDLNVPRNGDFFAQLQLCDTAGQPIDLTGHSLRSSARVLAGDGSVVASATIEYVERATGRFTILWRGSQFSALGEPTRISRFDYDIVHEYPDGIETVPVRGALHLIPEATP